MKTISLTQPWATLVAIGAKKNETRGWKTDHRGPLAIHASKSFPKDCQALVDREPFRSVLQAAYGEFVMKRLNGARGMVIATCELVACTPTDPASGAPRMFPDQKPVTISEQERAFGDYSPNRFFFTLANVKALDPPQGAVGALGLWDWHYTPVDGPLNAFQGSEEGQRVADQLREDRKLVRRLCDFAQGMNEDEAGFVEDISRRMDRGSILTPKQRNWAESIDRKRVP